jgi:hypothetical protein
MPAKTHFSIFASYSAAERCFEMFWRVVPQRRMESLRVVVHIHKRCDILAQIFKPSIFVGMDFLTLKREFEKGQEAASRRVMSRIMAT